MEYNIHEDVRVNPLDLDRDWVRQPRLYLKYAEALADARKVADEAKDDMEFTEAQLDGEAREDLAKGGKVTEAAVKAWITTSPKYRDAQRQLRDAKHEVAIMQAATIAMDHRKDALENLVRLHGQQYFAPPSASHQDCTSMDKSREERLLEKQRANAKPARTK